MNRLERELNNYQFTERVTGIQFGIMNPEDIRTMSVCEVMKPETYSGTRPVDGGLLDPRMGVIDRGVECVTCKNDSSLCPGHFGHIELAQPVIHIQFIHIIQKILSCVCIRCSTLLMKKTGSKINKILEEYHGEERFQYIYDKFNKNQKKSRCCQNDGCMALQPLKYKILNTEKIRDIGDDKIVGLNKEMVVAIVAEFDPKEIEQTTFIKKDEYLPPQWIYEILKRMTDEDCVFLGFNPVYARPEWMICRTLIVPPPSVRPSVQRENNQKAEDGLTHTLLSIIKTNNELKKILSKTESDNRKVEQLKNVLQFYIATIVDNDSKLFNIKNVQRSGQPVISIKKRLETKEGRIRWNLMGKRVDQSGRSVISVDPNISIDEFGMPKKMAMILTYPEIVTKYNIEELTELIRNGPFVHPGARKIERVSYDCFGNPAPCMINLTRADLNAIKLKLGDIVHRHIRDGDICLFNRQPSLHRMNMMGHKVRIFDDHTLKLHVFVCKPYNADFDGDEMNTHTMQNITTRIELEEICAVPYQIISPAVSKPIIHVVQDTLVGAYILSKRNKVSTGEEIYNLLMNTKILKRDFDMYKIRNKEEYNGFEFLSLILPDISFQNNKVMIKKGMIEEGIFDKSTLGGGNNTIIQAIFNQYSPFVCRDFLDNLQRMIIAWMENTGFTVGFGDAMPTIETRQNIRNTLEVRNKEVDEVIRRAQMGLYEPNLSLHLKQNKLEMDIGILLSKATNEVGTIVKENLNPENNFLISVKSGAKGKDLNLNQIMGTVGQQIVDGTRIPYGWSGRTLPHFTKWDPSLASRGFVFSSYMKGMKPHEFFFVAQGARVSSVNSHIKTAETGYIQRRLIKALEDLYVDYDGTVRNATGNIIQYRYGMDGCDTTKLQHIELKCMNLSAYELKEQYYWEDIESYMLTEDAYKRYRINEKKEQEYMKQEWEQFLENQVLLRKLLYPYMKEFYHAYKEYDTRELEQVFLSPIHFEHMIQEVQDEFPSALCDMTPSEIMDKRNTLKEYILQQNIHKSMSLLGILIDTFLHSKQIIEKKFNKLTFDYLLENMKRKYLQTLINPGEMVGIVAAQSIGEPLTQLVLNCIDGKTLVHLLHNNDDLIIPIGKYIDYLLTHERTSVKKSKHTEYLNLHANIKIQSVHEDGKIEWKYIERVSRHHADKLVKVRTKLGREVTATKGESFLIEKKNKLVVCKGSELAIGDKVPITKHYSRKTILQQVAYKNKKWKLTRDLGFYIGFCIGLSQSEHTYEEEIKHNMDAINTIESRYGKDMLNEFFHYHCLQGKKYILPPFSLHANKTFIIGLLQGYFETQMKWTTIMHIFTKDTQTQLCIVDLLSILGIVSRMYKNIIIVEAGDLTMFGKTHIRKEIDSLHDVYLDEVVEIEEVHHDGYVYDFTVEDTKNFCILGGLHIRDTFHFSGVGHSTSLTNEGVPRINEIINMSKDIKTPSMNIYLKPEYAQDKKFAIELKNKIEFTKLEDIVKTIDIIYVPEKELGKYRTEEEKEIYETHMEFMELLQNVPTTEYSGWMLWIEMDEEEMLSRGVYMEMVCNEITKRTRENNIQCIFSDMNNERIHIRFKIRREENSDYEAFFKDFKDTVLNIPLKGIPGIETVQIPPEKSTTMFLENGKPILIKEYYLQTMGSNMIEVLSQDYVDITRTTTNDIMEIHRLFGIEGTKHAIIRELSHTVAGGGTNEIDERHFEILADLMTYRGKIVKIQRHGFAKSPHVSPLAKATFEIMQQKLLESGIYSEYDTMKSTSSNIIMGQSAPVGTNIFHLILDETFIKPSKQTQKDISISSQEFHQYMETIKKQDVITENDFSFGFEQYQEYDIGFPKTKDFQLTIR